MRSENAQEKQKATEATAVIPTQAVWPLYASAANIAYQPAYSGLSRAWPGQWTGTNARSAAQ